MAKKNFKQYMGGSMKYFKNDLGAYYSWPEVEEALNRLVKVINEQDKRIRELEGYRKKHPKDIPDEFTEEAVAEFFVHMCNETDPYEYADGDPEVLKSYIRDYYSKYIKK